MKQGYLLPRHRSLNRGGKRDAKAQIGSSSFSTDNRRSCWLVRSSRASSDFAITESIGSPAGRLHQRWSALPIRTRLGLSSAFGVLLCALRPLLWRALAVSVTPLALALLAGVIAAQRNKRSICHAGRHQPTLQRRSLRRARLLVRRRQAPAKREKPGRTQAAGLFWK